MTREEKISLLTDCCFKSRCGDCAIRQGKYESPVLKSGCVRLQTASDADLDKALKIIGKAGNTMTDRERELQEKYNEYFDKYHDLLREQVKYEEIVTKLLCESITALKKGRELLITARNVNVRLNNEIAVYRNRIENLGLLGIKESERPDENDIQYYANKVQNYCLETDCHDCVFARKYPETDDCVLRNPDRWFECESEEW